MIPLNIPLVDWGNGTIMIGVFALVVIIIIGVIFSLMSQGSKKDDTSQER